jgi:predicted MFS family arabinose efflux permease
MPSTMHSTPSAPPTASAPRHLWIMLLALIAGFTLSQAFRTAAAILVTPMQAEFGLTPTQMGLFAGTFHFAFGALQIAMGLGIDLHGVRRTVLAASPLAVLGASLCALAPDFGAAVLGQALIGAGCAPAFLACTVFIARRFPAAAFTAVSGMALGLGSVGLLLTGTPLAWLVARWSWRAGFAVLAGGAALAWLAIFLLVREDEATGAGEARPTLREALAEFAMLLRAPHTWGILALAFVCYAAFITLRGLWLGPMLIEQYGFTLVQSGHVALVVSATGLFSPPAFGRLPVQGARERRHWIVAFSVVTALMYAVLATTPSAAVSVTLIVVAAILSGAIVLQYADVRSAYPASQTGRAMALFTMAMFLGVAFMQWITGVAAAAAIALGQPPYTAVNATIALLLLAGTVAFARLPMRAGGA